MTYCTIPEINNKIIKTCLRIKHSLLIVVFGVKINLLHHGMTEDMNNNFRVFNKDKIEKRYTLDKF